MGASSLTQTIPYATAGNFTFDSALVEFVSSRARLKDQRPTGATFHANYNSNINGNWADGALTGTATGAAAVASGKLDLSLDDLRYVTYAALDNADFVQTGTVEFKVTPNYSGNPSTDQNFYTIHTVSTNGNHIFLRHLTSGALQFFVYNSGGGLDIVGSFGTWVPVSGVEYEFSMNMDFSTPATRLFIDGTQQGSTNTTGVTRSNAAVNLRIGTDAALAITANFKIDDVLIFDTVQHTANYTAGAVISATIFSQTNPTVINNSGVLGDALESFTETADAATSDEEIKYTINVDGQDKYWDGDSWEDSDGTYAQSNTPLEITTNKAALDLSNGGTIKIKAFLHANTDGTVRPLLEQVVIGYNFFNTQTEPATCTVYGWFRNAAGVGVAGVSVTFELVRGTSQYREAGDSIIEKKITVTTNAQGRFESDLVRSSEFEAGGTYKLTIEETTDSLSTKFIDSQGQTDITFTVPDAASVNITDQITAVA